jgi:tetratricopeptide (TPR) repeat protein
VEPIDTAAAPTEAAVWPDALGFDDAPVRLPRWADALGDEAPALRLGELLRLDGVPIQAVPAADLPLVVDRSAVEVWDGEAGSRSADLVPAAVEPLRTLAWPDEPPTVPDAALADAYDVALDLPLVRHDVSAAPSAPVAPVADARTAPAPADDLLDLGAWLRETTEPATTRLTTAAVPQTGDEQADFDVTLRAFTAGVARAVDHADWDSHYDLGVAFREMGLVEEAIVEFQRAAGAPGRPLRVLEALAQCFMDIGQPEVALSTLEGAVAAAADSGTGDASLVGVHYLMGSAAQALGRPDAARRWLVRVVATDVRFRDAAARLAALPPPNPVR